MVDELGIQMKPPKPNSIPTQMPAVMSDASASPEGTKQTTKKWPVQRNISSSSSTQTMKHETSQFKLGMLPMTH